MIGHQNGQSQTKCDADDGRRQRDDDGPRRAQTGLGQRQNDEERDHADDQSRQTANEHDGGCHMEQLRHIPFVGGDEGMMAE